MLSSSRAPRVAIVGAGFGGLRAARLLRRAPVEVRLLDQNNYHLFQPLLYQVATAGLEPEQIAKPIRGILRGQDNLTFQLATVSAVDLESRRLRTDAGEVAYDYLILAVGAETNFFGMTGLASVALKLKELQDGVEIRSQVLRCFERSRFERDESVRRRLLTFVIVGGGPTGVEMAGSLSELIHLVLTRDYPGLDEQEVRILLLEAQNQLLPGFPTSLAQAAQRELESKGVEVKLESTVEGYDGQRVHLSEAEPVEAQTLVWAAGVQGHPLVQGLGIELGKSGRVRVEPTLQLPGHPEVYVIGDAAYLEAEGAPLPMMAPVAMQMAERAVANLVAQLEGKDPQPFQYRDPGSLATIGRNAAVAKIGRFKFKGFVAWVVWLVVHLIQLIGFRNRLFVLINWAWDYFFYERGVRLITAPESADEG